MRGRIWPALVVGVGMVACSGPGGGNASGASVTPNFCSDGVRNVGETDVDCGGDCAACGEGMDCTDDGDCASGRCDGGVCAAPACDDGLRNGTETDVDCGGSCDACGFGQMCADTTDCDASVCVDGVCSDPPATCTDNEKGPGETDVDCGGPNCPGCPTTKFCVEHSDCLSETCIFGICKDPTCDDGLQNQGESDIDCGGPCDGCEDGKVCVAAAECASDRCQGGVCVSCTNGVKDPDELGVDCGGECAPCGDGTPCDSDTVCGEGHCYQGFCVSCTNGTIDGDETDIDCGGTCGPCGVGDTCASASDCGANLCEGGTCCVANACGVCGPTPAEVCNGVDDDCDGQVDEASDIGAPTACVQDGVCAGSQNVCAGAAGWVCDASVYSAHSADWEQVETSCDGLDNDCDGEVDEGLINSCGTCGPAPIEVCDGLDNNCDGQVDNSPECGACGTTVEVACGDLQTTSNAVAWFDGRLWLTFQDDDYDLRVLQLSPLMGTVSDQVVPTPPASGGEAHMFSRDGQLLIVHGGGDMFGMDAMGNVTALDDTEVLVKDVDVYGDTLVQIGSAWDGTTMWKTNVLGATASSWSEAGAYEQGIGPESPKVAIGPNGEVALAGRISGYTSVSVTAADGGASVLLDTGGYPGNWTIMDDLAFDADGRLHLMARPANAGFSQHWVRDTSGQWAGPHTISPKVRGRFLRMPDGGLTIIAGGSDLLWAHPNADYTSWTMDVVDSSIPEQAWFPSGIRDDFGRVVMAYTLGQFGGCVAISTVCPDVP